MRTGGPIQILLVEDSPSDVLATREAVKESKLSCELQVVEDGAEALAFLRREGRYTSVPTPDLVLLDWNLPRKDGREVLMEIKSDEHLRLIPVVVLTSSMASGDVIRAYGLHANCCITRPADFKRLVEVVSAINHFWFDVVTLPSRGP